ncbi:MAG: hypothetical protein AMXMBFR4_12120 [Candidatus Hydrogenedentota bacterium]
MKLVGGAVGRAPAVVLAWGGGRARAFSSRTQGDSHLSSILRWADEKGSRNQTSICGNGAWTGPMFAFGRTAAPETDYGGIGKKVPRPVPNQHFSPVAPDDGSDW